MKLPIFKFRHLYLPCSKSRTYNTKYTELQTIEYNITNHKEGENALSQTSLKGNRARRYGQISKFVEKITER